jgi:hypothetical protein
MKELHDWIDFDMLTVPVMTDKINNGKYFAFARYGDGEFDAMVGTPTEWQHGENSNCDGHVYFPEMGSALKRSLLDWRDSNEDNYYAGIHWGDRIGKQTYDWLKQMDFDEQRKFADNSVFHIALKEKRLHDFYEALKEKEVVIVSNRHVRNQTILNPVEYINCPETNSWNDREKIIKALLKVGVKNRVVLFCSGPPTGVFINDIWQIEKETTLIDYGSNFDPNVGINSRNFHKKL